MLGLTRLFLVWMVMAGLGAASAATPDAHSAAALHAEYASSGERLQSNPFQRALYLDSSESSDVLQGDVHALVDYPLSTVVAALAGADDWCDLLILHINTQYCRATAEAGATRLTVGIGRKTLQPVDDLLPIAFNYRVAAATEEYLEIRLDAQEGPLGTRDYHIRLQAVPAENGRTYLHLGYSYAYGLAARLAMKAYLATVGRDKVGFTITGTQADGRPEYIGGVRGVVERNTMRYFLAIDASLGAFASRPSLRTEKRLQDWFTATERYPRQLHEVSQADYFAMKRGEYRRQRNFRSLR